MGYNLKIDVDAIKDIHDAFDWFELQSKGLGIRFKKQVKSQIYFLHKNPFLNQINYNNVRCKKIDKFPFLLHYNIDENLKIIKVFAVFHTSRNPKIWNVRNK